MARFPTITGPLTLVLALAFGAAAGALPARGAEPARRPLAVARDTVANRELHLARAVAEQSLANLRGVVEHLEAIDPASAPEAADADRAAFLLGQAYLRLGSRARFAALAAAVSRWPRQTGYTRWLAYQGQLLEAAGRGTPAVPDSASGAPPASGAGPAADAGAEAADALAASLLLERGDAAGARRLIERMGTADTASALALCLEARALAASGADDGPVLERLSVADTLSSLGRDLAGLALVQRATRAMSHGEDPQSLLLHVPVGSRYASRARHMLGLWYLEQSEREAGVAVLTSLLAGDSTYAQSREVRLALAGAALDGGSWSAAEEQYAAIDQAWTRAHASLEALSSASDLDSLWTAWEANGSPEEILVLDALPARQLAEQLVKTAADLDHPGEAEPPPFPVATTGAPAPVPPPPAAAWRQVGASAEVLGEAGAQLERARWDVSRERERLEGMRRYLAGGLKLTRAELGELGIRGALLDSLQATLDALDARIRAVRDEATRQLLRRSAAMVEDAGRNVLWMHAMRHFRLDGPNRERAVAAPPGLADADSLLTAEEALAWAVRAAAERMAHDAPDLIARSYRDAWRPGLIDRSGALAGQARDLLAWARRLEGRVDSAWAAATTSPELLALEALAERRARGVDSLRAAHHALRNRVAREAVAGALAAMEGEREAIDYGLAAVAYDLGVRLTLADSSDANAAPARASAAESEEDTGLDDPEAARWRAIAGERTRSFLERHPDSPARGEMRFRLADLLLVDARQDFRERMARYVEDQAAGRPPGPLPLLSHAPALKLYRAILAEDRDFAHLDAVLFNAAMILADESDPEAEGYFVQLVTDHPGSTYAQESYLRLGDLRFNDRRYRDAVAFYEKSLAGADPSLRAIALYKTGWAHFNEERFAEAGDAFRGVLDLYASLPRASIGVDLEDEAEAYLIHSLARAGGAEAFARYFDRIGSRPYEKRVLMAMGQQFRRLAAYREAASSDALFLERYPKDAEALTAAQRLLETRQRFEGPEAVDEALLTYAPRFAPGSPWFEAQPSDSARAAGGDFARASWKLVANRRHLAARAKGAPEDWRTALELYETVLARWPDDPEAADLELRAGEAASRLDQFPAALRHYAAAATSPVDSTASQAMWQRVAVADAWYQNQRRAAPGAAGGDSLARVVIGHADELLSRFPQHPKAPHLMWRQGNLAFVHGWMDEAARRFGTMGERFPDDPRVPRAAILRADALFRLGQFEASGGAYEAALAAARRAHEDSLARRAADAIPVAYYKHAEAAVAADSTRYEEHALLFERVAARWPRYEHAPLAQYRAGLAWLHAGKTAQAVAAMDTLILRFPKSEYVKDASLQIAKAWESGGQREQSARAYAQFAERYSKDESADDAWLKAADLYQAAGLPEKAEAQRLAYIRQFPDDAETAMEILEPFAKRDLAGVDAEHPISKLLPAASRPAKPVKGRAAKPVKETAAPTTHLAEYLKRAEKHPELASKSLLAQVRFQQGEEARVPYAALALRQPLAASLAAKQRKLDEVLGLYKQCMDDGVAEWAHASAFRIGEALVAFGEALQRSERPADLQGDALTAYEEVLVAKSQPFYDRGEQVWGELLQRKGHEAADDPWVARAQAALWPRLGSRFLFRPEFEFPVMAAKPPTGGRGAAEDQDPKATHVPPGGSSPPTLAEQKGDQP